MQLGCERLICVASGLDRPQLDIQHRVESKGLKFNLVSGPRPLINMIGNSDQIVVIGEGLLPDLEIAEAALGNSQGIAVLPVEPAIAAGFERIDLNHAWAGVLVMPGRMVGRLGELPADCDTLSALLRIALQSRVAERSLPEAALAEGRWSMIQSKEQLAALEPDWIGRHAANASPFAPGRALARLAMRRFGRTMLGNGIRPELVTGLGIAIAAAGVGSAWLGQATIAFASCGLGWLLIEAADALGQIAGSDSATDECLSRFAGLPHWLVDLFLLAVFVPLMGGGWDRGLVVPILLLGLVNLSERRITAKWFEFLQDRAVLTAVLALVASTGFLEQTAGVISVLLLGALLADQAIDRS